MRIMNWKGFGRKRLWPSLRHYPSTCLDGLRKPGPGRDFNPERPENVAGVITRTFGLSREAIPPVFHTT
jgi:hypothetical protein